MYATPFLDVERRTALKAAVAALAVAVETSSGLRPALADGDAADTAKKTIGYRGDGTGVFNDCVPVVEWSETNNVVWKTPLPNLGQGSPIYVDKRVYVMCEPGWKSDAPLLVCIDAQTGDLLWQREVDQFDLLPEADRAEAKALRKQFFELWRQGYELAFRARGATAAELEAIKREADAAGIPFKGEGERWEVAHNAFWHGETSPYRELKKRFDFRMPIWHHGCEGMTFPTPISDGQRLYVVTAYKVVACYDLEGRQQWMRWHRDEPYTHFIHVGEGKEHGMHFSASYVPSPVLAGDTLVVNGNTKLRGYDKTTGETRWEQQLRQVNYMVGTPVRLRLLPPGGKERVDVVFTASGEVVRVADGTILAKDIGQFGNGSGPIAIGEDVIFGMNGQSGGHYRIQDGRVFTDRGGVAIRLVWKEADRIEPQLVWHSRRDADTGEVTPVFHNGVIYVDRFPRTVDASTGEAMGKPQSGKALGHDTKHAHTVAGGYIFTINKDGKSAAFHEKEKLELAGLSELDQMPALEGDKREQVIAQTGQLEAAEWYGWNFSPALPFFSGNRIFVRSHDYLYCLGDPAAPTRLS